MSSVRSTVASKSAKSRKPRGGKAKQIAAEMELARQREKKTPARGRKASSSTPAESIDWDRYSNTPIPMLQVRQLALVDESGRVRALLGTDGREQPQLKFFNEAGDVTHEAFALRDRHGFRATDTRTDVNVHISATRSGTDPGDDAHSDASLYISDEHDNILWGYVKHGCKPVLDISGEVSGGDAEPELELADDSATATPSTPADPGPGFPLIRLRDYAEKAAEGLGKDDVVFMQGDEIFVAEEKYLGTAHKGEWCSLGKLPGGVSAHRVETMGLPTGWADWWIGSHDRIERLKRLCEAETEAGIAVHRELMAY